MDTLEDFKLTDLIKLRNFFEEKSAYYMTEYGVNEGNKDKYDALLDHIDFIDRFIIISFQEIKLDTTMPTWYSSKEQLINKRKEMLRHNEGYTG